MENGGSLMPDWPIAVIIIIITRYNVVYVQSALFNFHSFLTVVLLVICTCTYLKMQFPAILEQKTGFRGFFWKAARIGERLSPWMSVGCFMMGVSIIFF
ncbi:unnamed protein product [Brassica oleracea]